MRQLIGNNSHPRPHNASSTPTPPPPSTRLRIRGNENHEDGVTDEIANKFSHPHPWITLYYLVEDMGCIALGWWLWSLGGMVYTVLSLVLLARAQNGFNSMLHDHSHGNALRGLSLPRHVIPRYLITTALVMASSMMWYNMESFRRTHTAHHRFLRSRGDPDHGFDNASALVPYRRGYNQTVPSSFLSVFCTSACDYQQWRFYFIGGFWHQSRREAQQCLTVWVILALLMTHLTGISGMLWMVVGWVVARATAYHTLSVVRELCEHFGTGQRSPLDHPLDTSECTGKSGLKFTRTSPSWQQSVLGALIHPHNDNYHIVHHFWPSVPLSRLAECHSYLLHSNEAYAAAEHCESYFWGPRSILASVTRSLSMKRFLL